MAALEGGVITPGEGLGAGQCITVSTEQFCNAGQAEYGAVGLVQALKVSSDTYFFEVGERANAHGDVIQNKAHQLGIGQDTGIDLPSEFEGVDPRRGLAPAREPAPDRLRTRTPPRRLRDRRRSAALERRRQHAPRRRPGRPPDRPAADGGRLLDPRQRLHERRQRRGRDPPHRQADRRIRRRPAAEPELPGQAPRAPEPDRPRARDAGHPRGRQRTRRHLGRRVGGLEPVRTPRVREDRHGPARKPEGKTSPGTCATSATPSVRS